jgi:hypothetical protein
MRALCYFTSDTIFVIYHHKTIHINLILILAVAANVTPTIIATTSPHNPRHKNLTTHDKANTYLYIKIIVNKVA